MPGRPPELLREGGIQGVVRRWRRAQRLHVPATRRSLQARGYHLAGSRRSARVPLLIELGHANLLAALVEPLAVAWHAVRESGITAGQTSLVFGAGPIGLAIIQCLKAIGAGEIIAVELATRRQEFAKQFGAAHILDPSHVDVVKEAQKLTGGRGPAVAFDCAGVPSSLDSATRAVCARGTIVNVAIVGQGSRLASSLPLLSGEISLIPASLVHSL